MFCTYISVFLVCTSALAQAGSTCIMPPSTSAARATRGVSPPSLSLPLPLILAAVATNASAEGALGPAFPAPIAALSSLAPDGSFTIGVAPPPATSLTQSTNGRRQARTRVTQAAPASAKTKSVRPDSDEDFVDDDQEDDDDNVDAGAGVGAGAGAGKSVFCPDCDRAFTNITRHANVTHPKASAELLEHLGLTRCTEPGCDHIGAISRADSHRRRSHATPGLVPTTVPRHAAGKRRNLSPAQASPTTNPTAAKRGKPRPLTPGLADAAKLNAARAAAPPATGRSSTGNLSFPNALDYNSHFVSRLAAVGTVTESELIESVNAFLIEVMENPLRDAVNKNANGNSKSFQSSEEPLFTRAVDGNFSEEDLAAVLGENDTVSNRKGISNVVSAIHLLNMDALGRATQRLGSAGVLPMTEEVAEKLKVKYPASYGPDVCANADGSNPFYQPAKTVQELAAAVKDMPSAPQLKRAVDDNEKGDTGLVESIINNTEKGKAGGPSGLTFDTLKGFLRVATASGQLTSVLNGLINVINCINNADITNPKVLTSFRHLSGVALVKTEGSTDPRPIGIGETFLTLAAKSINGKYADKGLALELMGASQLACFTPAGIEINNRTLQTYMNMHPDHVLVKNDARNAFNATSRAAALHSAVDLGWVQRHAYLRYGGPNTVTYHDKSGNVSINVSEGVIQGDVFASLLYSVSQARAVKAAQEAFPDVLFLCIADDVTLAGPVDRAFAARTFFKTKLKEFLNVDLEDAKTIIYTASTDETARQTIIEACNAAGFALATDGVVVCGSPIGSRDFQLGFFNSFVDATLATVDSVINLAKLMSPAAGGFEYQKIYNLVRLCIPTKLTHLLRALVPEVTTDAAVRFDVALFHRLQRLFPSLRTSASAELSISSTTMADRVENNELATNPNCHILYRTLLPFRNGGGGITGTLNVTSAAYAGSLIQTGARVVELLGGDSEPKAAAVRAAIPSLSPALALVRKASNNTVNPVTFFSLDPRNDNIETSEACCKRLDAAGALAGGPAVEVSEDEHEQPKPDPPPGEPEAEGPKSPPGMPTTCKGWQKWLTVLATSDVARDIFNSIETKSDKANFLGFSHPFSSAWLSAAPTHYTMIQNEIFLEAIAVRCGVPPTLVDHTCRCTATATGKTVTITPASALQHVHSNSSEAKSIQTSRHEAVKWTFTNEMRTLLGLNNVVAEKGGQHNADKSGYMTRLEKNGNFNKNATSPGHFMCADLFVRLGDANLALDVNIAFPGGTHDGPSAVGAGFGVKRGSVADQRSLMKQNNYASLYDFNPNFLAPITFETNGCPGASTVSFLGAVKKWVREEGSTIQKKTVGTCIRRLVIRTSVTLARSLGSSVLAYRKVCQKGAGRAGV